MINPMAGDIRSPVTHFCLRISTCPLCPSEKYIQCENETSKVIFYKNDFSAQPGLCEFPAVNEISMAEHEGKVEGGGGSFGIFS